MDKAGKVDTAGTAGTVDVTYTAENTSGGAVELLDTIGVLRGGGQGGLGPSPKIG